ncbi:MAG: L,D-transpeptidase [bacterium]
MRAQRLSTTILFALLLFSASDTLWGAEARKRPSLCKVRHPSDAMVEWDCRRLKKGETPEELFGERWKDVVRFNRIDRRHIFPGLPLKVPRRLEEIANYTPMPAVYPPAESEAKFILLELSEQFLGAYEYGRLVFSAPATTGERGNETPTGDYRITARDSRHRSTLYSIEDTDIPYPMTYALRFYVNQAGTSFWIHGRDLPGYPESHGCVGLSDEFMQKKHYRIPREPVLEDARTLFEWAIAPLRDDGKFGVLEEGPRLRIVGTPPVPR